MITEPENPRAAWATLVSRRAKAVFPNKPENTLAGLLECSPWEVKEWLSGRSTPDVIMHPRLMDALALPNTVDDIAPKQLQGVDIQLAILRTRLDELYPKAMEGQNNSIILPKERLPGPNRAAPVRRNSDPSQVQRGEYRDHEAIVHLRKHQGGIPYEDLPDKTLRDYIATTQNAHEYLRCYRVLKGLKQRELRDHVSPSYGYIETGHYTATPDAIEKIREHVFGSDSASYHHFVDLSILNRQAIIHHHLAKDNHDGVLRQKEEMPPVYWQKSLEHFLHPAEWEAQPNTPVWPVEEIQTQGQYLLAIRRALQLHAPDIESAFGISQGTIYKIEKNLWKADDARQKLLHYYQKELSRQGLDYLDMQRLDALPAGEIELKPKAYWLAAIVRLADKERWELTPDKPSWSDYLPTIDTQGKYFMAMRQALGISASTLALDIDIGYSSITAVESDRPHMGSTALSRQKMTDYYQRIQGDIDAQEAASGVPPEKRTLLFSKAVLESLPITRAEKSTERQR
jgi:transcriptional regulator with XRE-family HTH domain